MRHRIHAVLSSLTRALHPAQAVHFHAGEHGRAYLCEHPHCDSPALHTVQG